VILTNGATLAGALFRPPWEDLPEFYGLRSLMRQGDPTRGEPTLVDSYFHAKGVFTVTLPAPKSALPRIIAPNGVIPRMQ
jgi:hypothetical protein